MLLPADCCPFAAADKRAWLVLNISRVNVEIWLRDAPLTAEEVQDLQVAPCIKQILQQHGPLDEVGGDFTCILCL
jgi:hypothetical protein